MPKWSKRYQYTLAYRRRAKVNGTQASSFHVWSLVVIPNSIPGFWAQRCKHTSLWGIKNSRKREKGGFKEKEWMDKFRLDLIAEVHRCIHRKEGHELGRRPHDLYFTPQ